MLEKYVVLRLTLKIDLEDTKEKAFACAMLRRLNVLFAKARPKNGLAALLGNFKLSDAYAGTQKVGEKPTKSEKRNERKALNFRVVKSIEKIKPETIIEQSMEPPELPSEIREG